MFRITAVKYTNSTSISGTQTIFPPWFLDGEIKLLEPPHKSYLLASAIPSEMRLILPVVGVFIPLIYVFKPLDNLYFSPSAIRTNNNLIHLYWYQHSLSH